MRNIILILLFVGIGFSCDDDRYDELNTDKKNPAEVPGVTLFTNGMREMFDMMVNTSVNENVFRLYAQYWAQTTYPDESAYNQVTREIPDNVWSNAYRDALKDMTEGRAEIEANPEVGISDAHQANRLAIMDINIAYTYAVLIEIFGDVPFEEALNPDNVTPAYDDGKTTYDKVITMLNSAISTLDVSEGGIQQDLVFGGDVAGWKMFANSLKLRMAMNYADTDQAKAQAMVTEALASGVILAQEDNTAIGYLSASPNTNPLYEDLVQSGRKDFIVANTLVDALNDMNDARIHTYATNPILFPYDTDDDDNPLDTEVTDGLGMILLNADGTTEWKATPFTVLAADADNGMMIYRGGVYGTANSHAGNSHIGTMMFEPDLPGTIFSCSEVYFLLAEAAERGITGLGNTAEEFYDLGITASFDEWGVSGASAYLANPNVAYTSATGTWKQKIGFQAWLANYNRGFEGWTTWRRLDFDGFNPPPDMTAADIPTRLIFPTREASLNGDNWAAAGAAIGGDTKTTKLWWDKN
jgi:hypothetical protein